MESTNLNRREFLKAGAAIAAASAPVAAAAELHYSGQIQAPIAGKPDPADATGPAQKTFPRWRGFNLTYFFQQRSDQNPQEDDFRWMRDWGFDFIRLPMTYKLWIEGDDVYKIRESTLEKIDRIVDWGRKYGIHTSLNFHRGPGYCVNKDDTEPFDLWKDQKALDAFRWHWALFAKRYRGVPSKHVSFDLLNEPPAPNDSMSRQDYIRVMRAAVETIRETDPRRLIIVDGLSWGRDPIPELVDLGVGQSTRGYDPMAISHYRASWVNGDRFPEPVWPDADGKAHEWDRKRLEKHYQPWIELAKKGVGVHCGECGGYNRTPHPVFLAWFRDVLEILKAANIGWGLWNFRGSFGILDSGRGDVEYEDWHGRKLDRKLLTLLQQS